ncbi:hypothetical protein BH11PLA2_BH11PLA2_20200 [soil metagenome]
MKLGPVHVIRHGTFDRLHKSERIWHHFSDELRVAGDTGNPLAARVLEHTHGLMHSPLSALFAPSWKPIVKEHARSREAAERVTAAFQKAIKEPASMPTASMWDMLTQERGDFVKALETGNVPAVQTALDRLFVSPLVHGLGQVHTSHLPLLDREMTHLHFHFTDTLVSLGEAVGACRSSCMGQDAPGHLRPLHKNLDATYEATLQRLGFAADYNAACGAFGFKVAGKLLTIDSLTHAYAAYRLAQLGGTVNNTVYELGGGYGGLALMGHRAGLGRYAIFDLPWVNALQGFFLILNTPPGTVRLHGETAGNLRIEPYWNLYTEAAKSCDWVVNSDSLPEMGETTASDYLGHIRRVIRSGFFSINQEAKVDVPGVGPQNCVSELVDKVGGYRLQSRHRHWLRQGYVEEVFA